jgi:hypothetical protein
MYSHVVMFRFGEPGDAEQAAGALRAMEGRIPQLRYLEVGIDDDPSERSAELVLMTRFDSREAYEVYRTHPQHLEVLAILKDLVTWSAKVDYAD